MKRFFLFNLAVLFSSIGIQAQKNLSLYVEGGGASPVLSLNIDSRFSGANKGLGFRAGLGMAPAWKRIRVGANDYAWSEEGAWKFTIPVALNYLAGNAGGVNFLELALGGTYIPKGSLVDSWSPLESGRERIVNRFMLSGLAGYRRSPVKQGVIFRLGYTPLVLDGYVVHWAAVSLGWKFKR